MAKEDAIEMFVGGLVLDPNTQAPVVILKDEAGQINLPIWIGIAEATSIASAIKQITMGRPLTHDLMQTMLTEMGARVQRVIITDLKDDTYYAELLIASGDKVLILDARPSDAIAIAIRASAPIFVTRVVLERAQMRFAPATSASPEDQAGAENAAESSETPPAPPAGQDLSRVDREKWDDILKSLDPEDFKYKM